MADDQQKPEDGSLISNLLKHWAPPALTATLSLIAGIWLAVFNSDIATNRFYLEKQATTADNVATQFSRYIENWARLVILRKEFDRMNSDPSPEQREYFKTIVFERADARDKLFSSLDSVHLYYSNKTSDLIVKFREWDNSQAELTVDKLPEIKEWRNWQIKILHKLREEIKKMMRYFFAVITIIPASLASSETNGGDWWKNCPGPACPARNPSESYMDMPIHKNNAGDAHLSKISVKIEINEKS